MHGRCGVCADARAFAASVRCTGVSASVRVVNTDITSPVNPPELLETALYAEDLAAAERFYVDVLGLIVLSRFEDAVALSSGRSVLLVFDPRRTTAPGRSVPPHGAVGRGHIAFAVPNEELPVWRRRLVEHDVEIESEVAWNVGRSLYFRDPAGNLVELAPPGLWKTAT